MNKVFLDTNVILDFLLKRKTSENDFYKNALEVINYCIVSDSPIYISILSIKDVFYLLTKLIKSPQGKNKQRIVKQKISDLLRLTRLAETTKDAFYQAMNSKFTDIEDGLQYFTATECDSNIIITRNKKDFKYSEIRVLTPHEFLNLPII